MAEYYHCHLLISGEDYIGNYLNDLSRDILLKDILIPIYQGKQFIFDGYMVAPKQIKRLKIVKTPAPAKQYIDRHFAENRNSGVIDLVTVPSSIPLTSGTDVTNEIIKEAQEPAEFSVSHK